MLNRVVATSARLACRPAPLASTERRTLPHKSGSQLTSPLRENWFEGLSPPTPLMVLALRPLPERAPAADAPTVGKKPERADCNKACACRYWASALMMLRLASCKVSINCDRIGSLNSCHQSPRSAASPGCAGTQPWPPEIGRAACRGR